MNEPRVRFQVPRDDEAKRAFARALELLELQRRAGRMDQYARAKENVPPRSLIRDATRATKPGRRGRRARARMARLAASGRLPG